MKRLLLSAIAVLGLAASANAATVTLDIEDTPFTTLFGQLTYEGTQGEILGFYDGGTSELKAQRYAAGSNAEEGALVESLTGLTMVNLGGTELVITDTSASVAANTYFTAKFGQSVGVFWNTTDTAIIVSFDATNADCAIASQCGSISHYKTVAADDGAGGGGDPAPVPLPAAAWLMIAGLGGLGALRRFG